ncbi:MAG: CDP-alcohol phosphatidyltransferase family protein [Patescibacteria group bacterium]|jgi:CDP-diacylglycerol--glycerol-3-phosphate 3-phosphatidyltransferase
MWRQVWRHVNVPNAFSFLRMLLVIPIWILNSQQTFLAILFAFVVYLFALATDALDGYTARKRNCVTDVGKLLDPLADKVLHVGILLQFQRFYPQINIQFALIVILAVVLAALPGMVVFFKVKKKLGSNIFGQIKMCVEGAAVSCLFLRQMDWAWWLLWGAVLMAGISILGHLLIKDKSPEAKIAN